MAGLARSPHSTFFKFNSKKNMKHIQFFFFFLLLSGYIQAARVTVTSHDGSVQNFNCTCSCADVQAYASANPNEFRSVSCSENQGGGGNFNATAECNQSINDVSVMIPSISKFPPKPTPTSPGIPADVKELFLMYEVSATNVKVYRVAATSDWKAILNGITFTGANKPYMFFYGQLSDGVLKINNQKVPVKDGTISAKTGMLLINGVPVDTDFRAPGDPEKPKGCFCVEEDKNGDYTGQNVDCPGGDCVKCCADAKGKGKVGAVPADIIAAIKKGQMSGNIGGVNYYASGNKGGASTNENALSSATYKTSLVAFSNNTYIFTQDNVKDFANASLLKTYKPGDAVPVVIMGVSKLPATAKIMSLSNPNGYIPFPKPIFPSGPVYSDGCDLVKCQKYDRDTEELTDYHVRCCKEDRENGGDCCELAAIPVLIDLTKGDDPFGGNNQGGGGNTGNNETFSHYIVVFSNNKYVYTKENVKDFLNASLAKQYKANEAYPVMAGGLKKLPTNAKLGSLAKPDSYIPLPKPITPVVPTFKKGCSYMNCSVSSSLDGEEITWSVLCCDGDSDCCATIVPMVEIDLK